MKNNTAIILLFSFFVLFSCTSLKQNTATEISEKVEETSEKETSEYMAPVSTDMESEDFAETIVLAMTKTPCFGECPVYDFEVLNNGMATYQGKKNVTRIGRYKAKIPRSKVNNILKEASSMGCFSLKSIYDNKAVSDLPSTITYLNLEGKQKKILCRFECDERILKINEMIEELIQNTKWELAG